MFGANSAPSSSSGGLPPASELLSPPTNGNSYNRHLPPTSPQMAPPSPYIGTPGHYQSLTEPGTPIFLNPASVGDPVASPSYESMSPASFTNQSAGSTKPSTPMADQASPAAYGQYANQPYYPPHYQPGRLPPAESLPVTSNFGPRSQNFTRKPPPRPGPPHPQGDSTLRQQLSRPVAHKAAPIDKRRHTISSHRTLPPLQQPLSVPPPSDHQPYYPPNGPKSVPNNFEPDRPSSHPSNHHSEPFEHDFEGHMSNEFDQYLPPAPHNTYYPQSPVPDPTYQQLETFQPENFPEFPEYPQDQFYDPQGNFIGSEVPYNVHQGPPPYDPNYPPGPSRLAGPQQVVYHSTGPNGQPQTVVHTVVDPQNYENGALRPEDPPNAPKTSSPKKGKKKAENDNGEPKPKPKRIRKSAAQLRAEKAAREAAALEAENGIATNPTLANPHERIQIHNGQITRQPVHSANGSHPQPQNLDQRPVEEIFQPSGGLDDSASLMPPPKVDRAPSVLAAKAAATEVRPGQSAQNLTSGPPATPGMGQSPGPGQMQSPIPSPNFHGPNGYNNTGMGNSQCQITPGSSQMAPMPPGLPISGPMAPAYTSQTGSVQTGPTYSGSHGISSTPGQAQVTGPHGSGYHPGPAASPMEYRGPPFGSHSLANSPYGHPQVDQYGQGLEDQELANQMDRVTPGFGDDGSLGNMDYNSQGSQGSAQEASQHGSAGSRTPSSTREEPHGELDRLEAMLNQEPGKKLPPKRVRSAAHRAEIQRQKFLKQREHELKQARENHQYLVRYMQLRKMVRALVFTNTALADEVSRVKTQIDVVTEQRKMVAKEVRHCERKRIRRMQTHERKARALKAKLEAAEQSGLNNLPFQPEPDSSTNNSFTYPLHSDTRPSFDPRNLTVKQEMASPGIRGVSGNGFGSQKMGGQGDFGEGGRGGNPTKFQLQSPQQVTPSRQGNGTARPQSEGKTGKGKRTSKPKKRLNPEQISEESPQPTKKKRLKKLEPLTVDTNFSHGDQERDSRQEKAPSSANRRLSSASQPRIMSPSLSRDLSSPQNLNNWPTDQIFLSPTELEPTAEAEPNFLQNFIPMDRYNRSGESPQRRSEEKDKTTPGSNDSVRTRFSARLKRQSQSELPASPRSRAQSRSQISPRTPSTPANQQTPQSANGSQSRDQSRRSSETPQARSRTHSNSVQNRSTTSQLQAQIKTEPRLVGPTSEKTRNLSATPRIISRNEKTPIKSENIGNPGQVQTRNSSGTSQSTISSTVSAKERPLPSPIKLNPTPDELKEMKFEPHPEPTESTLDQFDEDRSYKSTPTLLEPPIQLPEPKRRTSSRQSKKRQSNTPTSLTESPSTSSCTSPIPLGEGTIVTRRKAAEAASLATPTMQTRSKRKLHAS